MKLLRLSPLGIILSIGFLLSYESNAYDVIHNEYNGLKVNEKHLSSGQYKLIDDAGVAFGFLVLDKRFPNGILQINKKVVDDSEEITLYFVDEPYKIVSIKIGNKNIFSKKSKIPQMSIVCSNYLFRLIENKMMIHFDNDESLEISLSHDDTSSLKDIRCYNDPKVQAFEEIRLNQNFDALEKIKSDLNVSLDFDFRLTKINKNDQYKKIETLVNVIKNHLCPIRRLTRDLVGYDKFFSNDDIMSWLNESGYSDEWAYKGYKTRYVLNSSQERIKTIGRSYITYSSDHEYVLQVMFQISSLYDLLISNNKFDEAIKIRNIIKKYLIDQYDIEDQVFVYPRGDCMIMNMFFALINALQVFYEATR